MAWMKAAIVSAATLLALSGCSGTILSPTIPLPSMSHAELLRDQVARHEAAVAARAQEMATKGTSCADCAAAASQVAQGAAQRLEKLGGLWAPWPADLAQSANVERPLPSAEAPLLPDEFATWMMATAQHDLHIAAQASVDDEQRPLLYVSALSRMASALRLADAYQVSFDNSSVARLRASAAQYEDLQLATWASWWDDEHQADEDSAQSSDSVQSDAPPVISADDGEYAAGAVQAWDCVAQELPGVGVESERVDFANTHANALLERSTRILSADVADHRVLRCSLPDTSYAALASKVLTADLQMLMSSDPALQEYGQEFIAADIRTWYKDLTDEQLIELVTVPPAGLEPATNGL